MPITGVFGAVSGFSSGWARRLELHKDSEVTRTWWTFETHVCSQWRAAALLFPKLWSFIDILQSDSSNAAASWNIFDTYLARSGKYPLTFRLTDVRSSRPAGQPFLDELSKPEYLRRWRTVCIDTRWDLTLFKELGSSTGMPLLRVAKLGAGSFHPRSPDARQINLPSLEILSLALVGEGFTLRNLCDWAHFPRLKALNISFTFAASTAEPLLSNTPSMFPAQLKQLTALRLCGSLPMEDQAMKQVLVELPLLEYFGLQIDGYGSWKSLERLLELLREHDRDGDSEQMAVLPALRHLELARVGANDLSFVTVRTLVETLQARFLASPALRTFEIMPLASDPGHAGDELVKRLNALKEETGWDIRVRKLLRMFWDEEIVL
uniref:F-box domain-containing protein n=1 Tax=Mycena chlorophos TaxID=658473 RepID=A0ABQ0L7B9_MYCCL|nr:predicted protein [Mycena chlorophos]